MSEYKITLPDGTTIEAPTTHECVAMMHATQDRGPLLETASSQCDFEITDEEQDALREEMKRYIND